MPSASVKPTSNHDIVPDYIIRNFCASSWTCQTEFFENGTFDLRSAHCVGGSSSGAAFVVVNKEEMKSHFRRVAASKTHSLYSCHIARKLMNKDSQPTLRVYFQSRLPIEVAHIHTNHNTMPICRFNPRSIYAL